MLRISLRTMLVPRPSWGLFMDTRVYVVPLLLLAASLQAAEKAKPTLNRFMGRGVWADRFARESEPGLRNRSAAL